jgi:hypothetical protein
VVIEHWVMFFTSVDERTREDRPWTRTPHSSQENSQSLV